MKFDNFLKMVRCCIDNDLFVQNNAKGYGIENSKIKSRVPVTMADELKYTRGQASFRAIFAV